MVRMHDDHPSEEEPLQREGGVFVSREGGREIGCDDETCAPDESVEDPLNDDGVPGTPDDLPYDYGVEVQPATDQMLTSPDHRNAGFGMMGRTGADEDVDEPPLGAVDERELQRRQRGLISEASDEERRYAGLEDDDVARIEAASGEDAGEALPEAPEGESATGSVSGPAHGGFPPGREG